MLKNYKLNIWDYIGNSILASFVSILLYKFLYEVCHYKNLNDFYVGVTIYNNHNKYLDLAMPFVYILLFFALIPVYNKIKEFIIKHPIGNILDNIQIDNFLMGGGKKKLYVFLAEIILSFGYILLYPFDGGVYPVLITFISLLIIISIFYSYKNLYINEKPSLSILAVIPLFILLFGNSYESIYTVFQDDYHYGEKAAVFFLHNHYGLLYYKDIMLMHGLSDVASSWLGLHVFNGDTLYCESMGKILFLNLIYIISILLGYTVFKKVPIFLSFMLFQSFEIINVCFLGFLALLNKFIISKPFLFLVLYAVYIIVIFLFQNTYGFFSILASLPIVIYVFIKLIKNPEKRVLKILILLFVTASFLFLIKDFLIPYISEIKNYNEGILYSDGNNFGEAKLFLFFTYALKLFSLLILPYFTIELFKELKRDKKNIQYIASLIFSVIFVLVSLKYTLNRIDNEQMLRIYYISLAYLIFIIPYNLIQTASKYIKYWKFAACCILIYFTMTTIPTLGRWIPKKSEYVNNAPFERIGNCKFEDEHKANLINIKKVVDKYSKSDNDFYDLTNRGMLYFYLNKKIPVSYVSFYNSKTTRQAENSLKKLKENPPAVIFISTESTQFDEVCPSLRVNPIYRWILLEGGYSVFEDKGNVFLVKDGRNTFTKEDLKLLDEILSNHELGYLPDVWGASLKTLPIDKINIDYELIKDNNITAVKFNKPINGSDIDLINISTNNNKNLGFRIFIENSESNLFFKSKSSNVLFPFDNFPSFLTAKNINKIYVETGDEQIDIKSVEFYKRKSSK